jgi:hypothetical protein
MLKAAKERDALNRPFEKSMRQFGEIVMHDTKMLAKLDATRDAHDFINTYCHLAAEKGIYFTPDELRIVVQEQKNGSDWVLPKVVTNIVRELF